MFETTLREVTEKAAEQDPEAVLKLIEPPDYDDAYAYAMQPEKWPEEDLVVLSSIEAVAQTQPHP